VMCVVHFDFAKHPVGFRHPGCVTFARVVKRDGPAKWSPHGAQEVGAAVAVEVDLDVRDSVPVSRSLRAEVVGIAVTVEIGQVDGVSAKTPAVAVTAPDGDEDWERKEGMTLAEAPTSRVVEYLSSGRAGRPSAHRPLVKPRRVQPDGHSAPSELMP
jgi:hypothetical protein